MTRAILFSQMEPPSELEGEFNDWYETEHVPLRLAIPGMQSAARYAAISGSPKYLAIYFAESLALFDLPQYYALRKNPSQRTKKMLGAISGFTRFICTEIADSGPASEGSFLSVNAFAVPESNLVAFDDWYDTEHSVRLLGAKDWLRVRRYAVTDGEGGPWNRLALHDLASQKVMDSPERAFARTGPKRDHFVGQSWFDHSGRWLYRRLEA